MIIKGRAWKFGDNVDTDAILPGRYLKLSGREAAQHVMEGVSDGFAQKISPGDIIVAGSNFGGGSGRENATEAIKYAGIAAVVARSFSRLFFRSAINLGLPVIECPDASAVPDGHFIEVDLASGHVHDVISDETFHCQQMPQHVTELIEAGGLVPFLEKKLRSQQEQ